MAVEELNLVHLKAKFAKQKVLKISRDAFIQAATIRVLQVASKYLSDDVHFDKVSEIIIAWLRATGLTDEQVDFDPSEIGEEIGRIVVDGAKRTALAYQETGRREIIDFPDFSVSFQISCSEVEDPPSPTIEKIKIVSQNSFVPGMMVAGADGHSWSTSLHPAHSFDS
ncbi:hypothetical protein N9X05_09295 [Paracoccaceae bacterium]|nr:hypothetical protein [Paracoccaceae bacterium]